MPKARAWSDEDLRDAVARSTSYSAVQQALGLGKGGGSHLNVRARIRELGLDVSHFTSGASRVRSFRDESLREAVPASSSYPMLIERLGLSLDAATEKVVRRRVKCLGLSTLHFSRTRATRASKPRRWSDDALRSAVASSRCYAQVIRALGLIPAGGNYDHVQRRIRELGLDTSHFTGPGWNLGSRFTPRPAMPLEDVLVAGRWAGSHLLKQRLFRAGIKTPQCELCGWAQRSSDGRVPVELDHVNGDRTDNRLENLRILCPNCHSLQPTHRGLNQKSRRK
jgi:hypothetical protein